MKRLDMNINCFLILIFALLAPLLSYGASSAQEIVFSCRDNSVKFHQILELIKNGEEAALIQSFGCITSLDGGTLGDLYESYGKFFDKKPAFFLMHGKQHLTKKDFIFVLLKTPIENIDNIEQQQKLLSSRHKLLLNNSHLLNKNLYEYISSEISNRIKNLESIK